MRTWIILAVALFIGGCAFGRTYSYSDAPVNIPNAASGSVVLGPKGDELATNSVKGQDNIGNAGLSPGQTISGALGRKLESLFDNEKVITALK